ncbi:MAG: ferritin [Caldisericaceae bacterium]
MAGNMYEEPKVIGEKALDLHRAISSLMEELEAVDYYNQRANATKDPELKKVLEHNRDDEKEHASLLVEYIRRVDEKFGKELKEKLFTKESLGKLGD